MSAETTASIKGSCPSCSPPSAERRAETIISSLADSFEPDENRFAGVITRFGPADMTGP